MRISTTLPYFILAALPLGAAGGTTHPDSLPPELRPLVAKGESVLAYDTADLNGDGLSDFVFIVETAKADPDDRTAEAMPRTLKIALRSLNGSLKIGEDKTLRPPRDFGKIDIADFDPDHFEGVGAR